MNGRALGKGSWDLFGDIDGTSLGQGVGAWDFGVATRNLGAGAWDLGVGAMDTEGITRDLGAGAWDLGVGTKDPPNFHMQNSQTRKTETICIVEEKGRRKENM